jgi:hypothetical protein
MAHAICGAVHYPVFDALADAVLYAVKGSLTDAF